MLITLFTDASYCDRTGVAAYAAWAKTDGRTLRRAGVLKDPAPDSALAEAMALVNGIHLVLAGMRPPPNARIIAQTDCLSAIQAFSGKLRNPKAIQRFAPVVAAYRGRVEAARVQVELRHVGGHKGTVTPRNAVNTWCDQECRRLMRAARAALAPSSPDQRPPAQHPPDQRPPAQHPPDQHPPDQRPPAQHPPDQRPPPQHPPDQHPPDQRPPDQAAGMRTSPIRLRPPPGIHPSLS
jgi:ribonuclease HI